jgi:hypothetical protein
MNIARRELAVELVADLWGTNESKITRSAGVVSTSTHVSRSEMSSLMSPFDGQRE